DRLWRGRLHAVREFVAGDARLQLAVAAALLTMPAVQVVQELELARLLLSADVLGGCQVANRLGAGFQRYPLINRRHEASTPVARPVDCLARIVFQHDESWQVVVLRAQAVI